jgi:hypothetical protein
MEFCLSCAGWWGSGVLFSGGSRRVPPVDPRGARLLSHSPAPGDPLGKPWGIPGGSLRTHCVRSLLVPDQTSTGKPELHGPE